MNSTICHQESLISTSKTSPHSFSYNRKSYNNPFICCIRLRELHTLKGHVEPVIKLKGLDIGAIQQSYTV